MNPLTNQGFVVEQPSLVFKHFCEAVCGEGLLELPDDFLAALWDATTGDDRRAAVVVYDETAYPYPAVFENLARQFHGFSPHRKDQPLVHYHCTLPTDASELEAEADFESNYVLPVPSLYDRANRGVLAIYRAHLMPVGRPQENLTHLMTEGRCYYRPTAEGALAPTDCNVRLFLTVDAEREQQLSHQLRFDLQGDSGFGIYRLQLLN